MAFLRRSLRMRVGEVTIGVHFDPGKKGETGIKRKERREEEEDINITIDHKLSLIFWITLLE